ncbi:hypothetical protein ACFZDK_26805 [Streptomyces sp. NPDC007901]
MSGAPPALLRMRGISKERRPSKEAAAPKPVMYTAGKPACSTGSALIAS